MAVKSYFVLVFTVFIHIVTIQLAGSFLAISEQENSLMALITAIGLLFTFLKTPNFLMQLIMFATNCGTGKKLGSQIINVINGNKEGGNREIRLPRRYLDL